MFKKLLILFCLSLLAVSISEAGTKIETKTSPNYLIVLVHGVNTPGFVFKGHGENDSDVSNIPKEMKGFGDLLGYLRRDLGLDGYVYYYTFSQRDGHIEQLARELGDRNYTESTAYRESIMNHKGLTDQPDIDINRDRSLFPHLGYPSPIQANNCWLEQAREDFIKWFQSDANKINNPTKRPPTPSEIPQKFILIAHSMGGLVARTYMTSNYYQNDIAALITIDSQHLGSNGAKALKEIIKFNESGGDKAMMAPLLGATFMFSVWGWDDAAVYTGFCAFMMPVIYSKIEEALIKTQLGWYPDQPGVQDIDVESSFMSALNSKPFYQGDPVKVRFIAGHGIPTPSGELLKYKYAFGIGLIEVLLSSNYWNDIPPYSRLMALYMSLALGAVVDRDGDIYGTKQSQLGEGLTNLGGVDFKTQSFKFGRDEDFLADLIMGANAAIAAVNTVNFVTGGGMTWAKFGIIVAGAVNAANIFIDRKDTYLSGHGLILREVYYNKLIDKALEDFIVLGGKTNTGEARSNLSASSVSSPTASYPAPEQAFVLLTDLDSDNRPTGNFRTITIEAFTEGDSRGGAAFPVEISGQKKWVSSITVKEPPTAIKGVINTFLPKKLKYFNYSENFAAWKPIGAVDEWGNFTIKDLKLAAGQNVVAFDAESWIGNKMNQQLKIICNAIPCFPGGFYPEPNSYTNNPMQKAGVEFRKAKFEGKGSGFKVLTCEMDGVSMSYTLTTGEDTYSEWAKIEIAPETPLADGEHKISIKVQSDVGLSQAFWSYIVDTIPPTIRFLPSR